MKKFADWNSEKEQERVDIDRKSFLAALSEESHSEQANELLEQVSSISQKDFIKMMKDVYASGDERLVRNMLEVGSNLQVNDVADRIFKVKLPKAENGAKDTLVKKVIDLGLSPEDKLTLIHAIESGDAYDIKTMLRAANKTPYDLNKMVDTSIDGASELLPWFVEWTAKNGPDKGTRGKASTEIFIIAAGKNGRTPPKGDCMVDDHNRK